MHVHSYLAGECLWHKNHVGNDNLPIRPAAEKINVILHRDYALLTRTLNSCQGSEMKIKTLRAEDGEIHGISHDLQSPVGIMVASSDRFVAVGEKVNIDYD